MSDTSLLSFVVVVGIFLSLNPSTLAIFSALLAGSLGKGHSKFERHGVAMSFLLILFALYVTLGAALIIALNALSGDALKNVALGIAAIGALWGLIDVKEYYWYGKHHDISIRLAKTLHHRTVKKNDPLSALLLGITTAYAALPSLGVPLLATSTIIALARPYNTNLMLVFGAILVLPLILIFILSMRGLKISSVMKWKEDSKGTFRLCMGLTTILVSWVILLILNGSLGVTS